MSERVDRIPLIAEREDGIDRAMPLTLFDAQSTDEIIQRGEGLILPKGSRVVFEVGLVSAKNPKSTDYWSLGPTILNENIEVYLSEKHPDVYSGMPNESSMIIIKPDSQERREAASQSDAVIESIRPLYSKKKTPRVVYELHLGIKSKDIWREELDEIDSHLRREFLAQRQNDLDLFFIDPGEVVNIRLHAAVNKKREKPKTSSALAYLAQQQQQ